MKIFNIKIYKIIIWGICFLFLSHNSACVSIATGALEGANENQLRKNRINYATKSMGFDQAEFNDYSSKMEIAFACTDRIYEDPKYYQLKFKSPEVKSYKHYSDNSYISYNERILLSVKINEIDAANKAFEDLMGGETDARKKFIAENSLKVANLDI